MSQNGFCDAYIEYRECIFGLLERLLPLGFDVDLMSSKPDRSSIADGEREAERNELPVFSICTQALSSNLH